MDELKKLMERIENGDTTHDDIEMLAKIGRNTMIAMAVVSVILIAAFARAHKD